VTRLLCSVEGCAQTVSARTWCGRHYARFRRTGSTELMPQGKSSPGWGHGKPGGRYWTQDRIVRALKRYAAANPGPLPSSDHAWNDLKKGRMDLPTGGAILAIWHRMNRAWAAAGVGRDRMKFSGTRWSAKEKAFLKEHAGTWTLNRIAHALGRSYGSAKCMIGAKGFKITARANQGYWSAAVVSQHYGCSYARVCAMFNDGRLKGFRHPHRRSWQLDPADLTPEVEAMLRAAPKTHKATLAVGIPPRYRAGVPDFLAEAALTGPIVRTCELPCGMAVVVRKLWTTLEAGVV
jgi:hypothetical protein